MFDRVRAIILRMKRQRICRHRLNRSTLMNDATPIRVLVIHDDPLVCAGLLATLRDQPGFELVGVMDFDRYSCKPPSSRCESVIVANYEYGIELAASARMQSARRQPAPNVLIVTTRQGEREIRH